MIEITKEKYLEIKKAQVAFIEELKNVKKEHKDLQRAGNSTGIVGTLRSLKHDARIHNILYGLIRNKTYKQIENSANHFYYDVIGINNYTEEMMFAELAHDVAIEAKKFGIENVDFEEYIHG